MPSLPAQEGTNVTDQEKAILLRMTGLDKNSRQTRIIFATATDSSNYLALVGLVAQGLAMGPAPPRARFPGTSFFFVTEAGAALARRIAAEKQEVEHGPSATTD
jgi:hypothetical protein